MRLPLVYSCGVSCGSSLSCCSRSKINCFSSSRSSCVEWCRIKARAARLAEFRLARSLFRSAQAFDARFCASLVAIFSLLSECVIKPRRHPNIDQQQNNNRPIQHFFHSALLLFLFVVFYGYPTRAGAFAPSLSGRSA